MKQTGLNINDLEIVVFVVSHNIDQVPFASFDLSVAGAANVSFMLDAVMNQ